MAGHSSPGVYTHEYDLSQRTVQASTSIGVIVGEAHRGPVGERTLVTNEDEYIKIFGKPDATIGYMGYAAVAFLQQATQLYITRVAPTAVYGGCVVGYDGHFNTSTPFSTGEEDPTLYPLSGSELFVIYAKDPGDWNSDVFTRIYPDTRQGGPFFYIEVWLNGVGAPVEKWRCTLKDFVDGFGNQLNVQEQINRKSAYIRIIQNEEATAFVANPNAILINSYDAGGSVDYPGIQLFGGTSGRRPTDSELILAWDLYEDTELVNISLLINAGYSKVAIQQRMDEICRLRMDCVAILDMPSSEQQVSDALAYRRNSLLVDSSYSAIYSSDLLIADKYSDISLYVPPSGHVAACFALTDNIAEAWFAPAGMFRGNLSVKGVREVYDQGKRNALYDSQINSIRVIEGSGVKVWGADTLQVMASALSNVSVRRLMIVIEKTLSNALIDSVFEPNDSLLRSRISLAANEFLETIKAKRGLYKFEVICDDSNNPPASIAAGDLNVTIAVDPVLPAKRVLFTAVINRTGVRVTGN